MHNNNSKKSLAAIAYFWWLGWIASFLALWGKKEKFCKFHLSQAFVIHLLWTIITLLDLYIEDHYAHGQLLIWISWLILVSMSIDGITGALRGRIRMVPIAGWITKKVFNIQNYEATDNQRTEP